LEKFWAFHHYHGFPEGVNIKVNAQLKSLMDNDFKSLADFKAYKARHANANGN